MFKGTIASGTTLTADTNIPFVTEWNTNPRLRYNTSDNTVSILEQGYYDVYVSLPLSNVSASPITLQIYANGNPISEAVNVNTILSSQIKTIQIFDILKVSRSIGSNIANMSIRLIGGTATLNTSGTLIIRER